MSHSRTATSIRENYPQGFQSFQDLIERDDLNVSKSYATACPGPYLQARIDELIKLASIYLAGGKSEEEEDEDDMWKPTVHLRVNKSKFVEGTLAHPQIGLDLKPGEMRVEETSAGKANVYRGFKASSSEAVVAGWQAAYAKGPSTASSKGATDSQAYRNMQAAQSQMSVDLFGIDGKG